MRTLHKTVLMALLSQALIGVTQAQEPATTANFFQPISSESGQPTTIAEATQQGINEGRQQCISSPVNCQIDNVTQAELDASFNAGKEQGKNHCIENPATCGFVDGDATMQYNSTQRVKPQVIASGFTPSVIDLDDTNFELIALIRPGSEPVNNVTLKLGSAVFPTAMQKINTLPNGDELWTHLFVIERGEFGASDLPVQWGQNANQFNIEVIDAADQVSNRFPIVSVGNYPALD